MLDTKLEQLTARIAALESTLKTAAENLDMAADELASFVVYLDEIPRAKRSLRGVVSEFRQHAARCAAVVKQH